MDDKLKIEYQQCWETWRFLVGLRFTVFRLFLLLSPALFIAVLSQPALQQPGYKDALSLFGIVSTFLVITLECRNKQLYKCCLARAKALEGLFYPQSSQPSTVNADDCIAHLLDSAKARPWAWHGHILTLYVVVILAWIAFWVLG